MNELVELGETQDKIFAFIEKIESSEDAILEILNHTQTGSRYFEKQSYQSKLNEIFGTEYQGIEYEIPEILKSGFSRTSHDDIYYLNRICSLHASFITELLHAKISLKLKILILHENWSSHHGSATRLLRYSRDEALVACEQSRFQQICRKVRTDRELQRRRAYAT